MKFEIGTGFNYLSFFMLHLRWIIGLPRNIWLFFKGIIVRASIYFVPPSFFNIFYYYQVAKFWF